MFHKTKILSLALLVTTPAIVSANASNNKQLAGPPEEFEFMRPAAAELNTISSKTALIPVKLQQTKSGNWIWNGNIPLDSNSSKVMVFTNGSSDWNIEMINPVTKQARRIGEIATDFEKTKYGIEQANFPGNKYTFKNINTGNWELRIKTDGEPDQFEGFILISSESKFLLNSYKTNADQIVGHNIHFVTQSTSNEKTIEALKDFNPINSAFMNIRNPDGSQQKAMMFDDGLHGDKLANDGLFGGDFTATLKGDYSVQVVAKGQNPNGTPFLRTSEHFVPVIEQKITMDALQVNAFSISDDRLNIAIEVNEQNKVNDNRYRIIAEVWGANLKGAMTPVSWISTITDVNKGQLNIELDARWIAMAKANNSFELRNLRIEDADHFIPLVSQNSITLKVASLPKFANKSFSGNITQEMLMGKRPTQNFANKTSAKLMLVHGYCSSGAWGPYAGQFNDSVVFSDLNQNRSNDVFARKIRDFGAQFSSFGVVAHSQGGTASLHLYTYYWSGLDNSTGSRLIQSVGTPYQGTPLAGNLAALGNVFGIGCGFNSDLSTSGASSWLAGIPTWARNEVNYYTTSFKDRRWRYDYCSLATDLFLSDPDDGVVERSRAQLSGGINRGHKEGWCHTTGMRDADQASDSGRNATMNANAKR